MELMISYPPNVSALAHDLLLVVISHYWRYVPWFLMERSLHCTHVHVDILIFEVVQPPPLIHHMWPP